MSKLTPEMLGYVAGFLTTVSFVPQVLQVYRTRTTQGVSTGMLVIFGLGLIAWLWYGVWIDSPPVIVTNSVTLALVSLVLVAKWRWP